MINVNSDEGRYEIEGNGIELLSELVQIMRIMYKHGLLDDDRIETVVRLASITDKEIHKEVLDILKKRRKMTEEEDALERFFGDILGEQ